MFSRREREYLRLIADGLADRPDASGRRLSQGYRRKLHWAIRRKASRAISDWDLYLSAVQRDPRALVPSSVGGETAVPQFSEPFVTVLRGIRSALGRSTRRDRTPTARER
jgi:hypothetical protein